MNKSVSSPPPHKSLEERVAYDLHKGGKEKSPPVSVNLACADIDWSAPKEEEKEEVERGGGGQRK